MIQKSNNRSNIDHQPRQDSDADIEQRGQWWAESQSIMSRVVRHSS